MYVYVSMCKYVREHASTEMLLSIELKFDRLDMSHCRAICINFHLHECKTCREEDIYPLKNRKKAEIDAHVYYCPKILFFNQFTF